MSLFNILSTNMNCGPTMCQALEWALGRERKKGQMQPVGQFRVQYEVVVNSMDSAASCLSLDPASAAYKLCDLADSIFI